MIVPMKKVNLIIQEKAQHKALKSLRRAGIMHIQCDDQAPAADAGLYDEKDILERALGLLSKPRRGPWNPLDRAEALEKARHIIALDDQRADLKRNLADYKYQSETLLPWGDFHPGDIRYLAGQGVDISLVQADSSLLEKITADKEGMFITLGRRKKQTFGILIYTGSSENNRISGIALPEHGPAELASLMQKSEQELRKTEEALKEYARYHDTLVFTLRSVRQDIEFEEIRQTLSLEEQLVWLGGFVPAGDIDSLKTLAEKESWGLVVRDPEEDDSVPILVKNPPAIRIIQPVFKLMSIFPGYREPDISHWVLIFLSIFTAMILGDAAYGLIILAGSLAARMVLKKSSDTLRLLMLFGFITFLWGTLTGTWFSSLTLVRDTPLRHLVVPALATYQQELFPGYALTIPVFPGDALDVGITVQWISLLLGVLMIIIARLQNLYRKLPSLAAVAQLGWLLIVLALYWLIMNLVLQLSPLPFIMDLLLPMVIGGIALVLLFSGQAPGRSFARGLLESLKDIVPTLLNAIAAFGDIISFIRLFAVGLAGVALAQSFNAMAPKGGGIMIPIAVLILVFGHTLNIILSALSVLVHGVRLNILEFSGHLDMEWAGNGFDPFRLTVPEMDIPEAD